LPGTGKNNADMSVIHRMFVLFIFQNKILTLRNVIKCGKNEKIGERFALFGRNRENRGQIRQKSGKQVREKRRTLL